MHEEGDNPREIIKALFCIRCGQSLSTWKAHPSSSTWTQELWLRNV